MMSGCAAGKRSSSARVRSALAAALAVQKLMSPVTPAGQQVEVQGAAVGMGGRGFDGSEWWTENKGNADTQEGHGASHNNPVLTQTHVSRHGSRTL